MASSKRPKWSSPKVLYWIMHETYGGGVKFGPLERELVRWPQIFILFSERYYNIIVHELKMNFQDFQYQIF